MSDTPAGVAAPFLDEVVLHIGLGKAGTTSVQHFLATNRSRLAELGLLVPVTPGRPRHIDLGLYLRSPAELEGTVEWQRRGGDSVREFRQRFRRRLFRELREAGLARAILTDEDLFSSSTRAVTRARGLTERIARRVRLVAYVRRQDDHLVSRYQQAVKIGETARLDEYAERDWAWKYDYHRQLSVWREHLAPDRLVVRRYEPGRFAGGSLFQDFLDAADVAADADGLEQVESFNDALDVDSAEFVRLHNLYLVRHEGATPYLIDNRDLVRRLRSLSDGGPTLTLPDADLDRFMRQWDRSNRALAHEFLGEEGELFRSPRKTRETTTTQRLDRHRLTFLLDALEVPAAKREALERIADEPATD